MQNQLNYSFDKSLDYEVIKLEIENKINKLVLELHLERNEKKLQALSNLSIAMIQLVNGSRISEAIKATEYFVNNQNKKSMYVRIAKRTDHENRVMKLPDEINVFILDSISNTFQIYDTSNSKDLSSLSSKVRSYLYDNFGKINTHSLRYALINYLAIKKKVPLNLVSKIVGHKNINQLVSYTQNKHADNILDLLACNSF